MTIKIAFYSPSAKSGTTTHLFLFAWMLARKKPCQSIVIEQGEQYRIFKRGTVREAIVLSDCGRAESKRAQYRIRTADIVVVNLPAAETDLEQYFLYRKPEKRSLFFLLGNCHGDLQEVKMQMKKNYRIPETDVGYILYNNELAYAVKQKRLQQFLATDKMQEVSERNQIFFTQTEQSFFLFCKKLEQQMNE